MAQGVIQIGTDIQLLFPVMVMQRRMQDCAPINAAIAQEAYRRRGGEPGVTFSNAGGWQSEKWVFQTDLPAFAKLKDFVLAGMLEMSARHLGQSMETLRIANASLSGWININGPGDFNRPHLHPVSTWSGVYYVQDTAPSARDTAGMLELLDPRPGAEMSFPGPVRFGSRRLIKPEPGLLVMFPGYLSHWVHPHDQPGDRISVAFNCTIGEIETLPDPRRPSAPARSDPA